MFQNSNTLLLNSIMFFQILGNFSPWWLNVKLMIHLCGYAARLLAYNIPYITPINQRYYEGSFSCVADNNIHKHHPIRLIKKAFIEDMKTIILIDSHARSTISGFKNRKEKRKGLLSSFNRTKEIATLCCFLLKRFLIPEFDSNTLCTDPTIPRSFYPYMPLDGNFTSVSNKQDKVYHHAL